MAAGNIIYDLYSPHIYPWMSINFFLVFWFASNLYRKILHNTTTFNINSTFKQLPEDKKRNVVTYIAQLIATTIALVAQIYGGWDILFRGQNNTTLHRIDWMNFALQVVAVLYVWELCYREKIGLPLLVHHIVTLVLIQLVSASFFDTKNVLYLRFALLKGFHATVEQLSFVALFCFRLHLFPKYQGMMFYLATVQAFLLKTAVTVASIVFYVLDVWVDNKFDRSNTWIKFWIYALLPLTLILYAAQLYSCKILYGLARRCHKIARDLSLPGAEDDDASIQDFIKASEEHIAASEFLVCFENNGSQSDSDDDDKSTCASQSL